MSNMPIKGKKNSVTTSLSNSSIMPPKKKFKVPQSKPNSPLPTKAKKSMKLKCFGLPYPFRCELYTYEKNSNDDGYSYGGVKYIRGEFTDEVHELFDRANFTEVLTRREPHSKNRAMENPAGYRRTVFVRYPRSGESTPETRQEGLEAMKSFLMDSRFSTYPPKDIETVDMTNEDCYTPLDELLMDEDIEKIMKTDIPLDALNEDFYKEYEGFADVCWAGPNYSDWAKTLGFIKQEK
jgi:hypothetical protein